MNEESILVFDPVEELPSSINLNERDSRIITSSQGNKLTFQNKNDIQDDEEDIITSIQKIQHSTNYLEAKVLQKVEKESSLRILLMNEIQMIREKVMRVIEMIQAISSQSSYSPLSMQSNTLNNQSSTIHLYINPSDQQSASLEETLENLSNQLLSIEEEVFSICGNCDYSIPLDERLLSLQTSYQQLQEKSKSISEAMKTVTSTYTSIFKSNSTVLSKMASNNGKVKQIYNKVVEVEPLVMIEDSLKKKMDDLMILSRSIVSVENRVKSMEDKQIELEKQIQITIDMVNRIKKQMNEDIPQICSMLNSLNS